MTSDAGSSLIQSAYDELKIRRLLSEFEFTTFQSFIEDDPEQFAPGASVTAEILDSPAPSLAAGLK